MALNLEEIKELLSTIGQANIAEFELKNGDFELRISKGTVLTTPPVAAIPEMLQPAQASPPAPELSAASIPPESNSGINIDDKWVAVTSPMVGTFYRAPAPGEDPFVSLGDRISTGQTVCIIEAMKLMNELEAEVSGKVVKIVVEDGEPIEFGQTLMWVNPS